MFSGHTYFTCQSFIRVILYSLYTVCVNPGARLGPQVGKTAQACMVPNLETRRGPTGNERAHHDHQSLHASPERRRETRVQKKKRRAERIDPDTV